MGRKRRGQLLGHRLQLIAGVGRKQVFHDLFCPVEEKAAAVQGFQGIGEGRRVGIFGNGFYFFLVAPDSLEDRRLEMFNLNPVEGRGAERCRPVSEKWVVGHFLFLLFLAAAGNQDGRDNQGD